MTSDDRTQPGQGLPLDEGSDEGVGAGLGVVDYALGEGSAVDRDRFRSAFEEDLSLALELASVRDLFESCRELSVEPSGKLEGRVRAAVARRARLRRVGPQVSVPFSGRGWVRDAIRVAAVAVVALSAAFLGRAFGGAGSGGGGFGRTAEQVAAWDDSRLLLQDGAAIGSSRRGSEAGADRFASLLATDWLPVTDPVFVARASRYADRPIPDEFRGLLSAENRLSRLRAEAGLRFSPEARAELRRRTGLADFDTRISAVAREIARDVTGVVAAVRAGGDPLDLAFALRALVASGSAVGRGPHAAEVLLARDGLVDYLDGRTGGSNRLPGRQVTSLCALAELAVLGDEVSGGRIAGAADDVAAAVLGGRLAEGDTARPELLRFGTPLHALADAGRLLWIAPAFGSHPGLALRARMMVAAHVEERLVEGEGAEQPARLAALLYGFGDLVDREGIERSLSLWRPRLLRDDLVAVHHLAWSRYPVRAGWADFQRELRWLSGLPSPDSLRSRAALLLGLCTNVAAPGVGALLGT
jgi:hypothetical protein